MNKRHLILAAIVSLGLMHCATSPSKQLETAETKAAKTDDKYTQKANELEREQTVEGAELAHEHVSEQANLNKDYKQDVAEADRRVSEARARLYEDYVKFLADNQSRISNMRTRLERVQQQANLGTTTNPGTSTTTTGQRDANVPPAGTNKASKDVKVAAPEKIAEADRFLKAVQTSLDTAGQKTTKEWDTFKQSFQRELDSADRAIADAERAVPNR